MANSSAPISDLPSTPDSVSNYLGLDYALEWIVTSFGLKIDMTTTLIDKAVWVMERHRVTLNFWNVKLAMITAAFFLVLAAGRTFSGYFRPALTSQIICLCLSLMWAAQSIWIFEATCSNTVLHLHSSPHNCNYPLYVQHDGTYESFDVQIKWPVEGFITVLLFAAQSLLFTISGSQRLITFHRASFGALMRRTPGLWEGPALLLAAAAACFAHALSGGERFGHSVPLDTFTVGFLLTCADASGAAKLVRARDFAARPTGSGNERVSKGQAREEGCVRHGRGRICVWGRAHAERGHGEGRVCGRGCIVPP